MPARAASTWLSSASVSRRSARRSRRRVCSRRSSARPRSCGPTRSRPCWSRCRSATGSAGRSPTAGRRSRRCAAGCSSAPRWWRSSRWWRSRSCEVSVEAFDEIEVGAAVGSLVGVLALVAVPVLVLGAVAPWAIRLRVASVEDAGRTAGRLYALSTVGSLFGTFAAALLLIPLIGTQRTFIVFALLLAVAAATRSRCATLLAPVGDRGDARAPAGRDQGLAEGRILGERETEYQYARVIDSPTASAGSSSTRARRSTPSTGPTPCSPATSGTATSRCRSPCSDGRRARSRSSATAPARPSARTSATSRRRRSTASRSTRS